MSLPSSLVDFCTMGSFVKKAYLDLCFEENSGREITLHSIKFTISAFVRDFFLKTFRENALRWPQL